MVLSQANILDLIARRMRNRGAADWQWEPVVREIALSGPAYDRTITIDASGEYWYLYNNWVISRTAGALNYGPDGTFNKTGEPIGTNTLNGLIISSRTAYELHGLDSFAAVYKGLEHTGRIKARVDLEDESFLYYYVEFIRVFDIHY